MSKFNVDMPPGVDFTKLLLPSKKLPAHNARQKIRLSISPTIDSMGKITMSPDFMLKFLQNLTNLSSICQICAPFAKCHSPENASHSKTRTHMLMKSTPGGWNLKPPFCKKNHQKIAVVQGLLNFTTSNLPTMNPIDIVVT